MRPGRATNLAGRILHFERRLGRAAPLPQASLFFSACSAMALESLTAALTQLNENLAWEGDKTKAALALEAVRYLLVNRGRDQTEGDRRITFDTEALQKMEAELAPFVEATKSGTQSVTFTAGRPLYG